MSNVDNERLDKLYKLGATEIPSKKIDLAILNQAEKDTSKVKYSHKWRYMMPVAASMVLVSLLYFDNEPHYKNNLEIDSAPQFKKRLSPVQDASFPEKISEEASIELNEMKQESVVSQGVEYKAPAMIQKTKSLKSRSSGPISLEPVILKKIDDLIEQGETAQAKQMLMELVEQNPNMKSVLKARYPEYFKPE